LIEYEEAAHGVRGYEPLQEDTTNQQTISLGLSFSLHVRMNEGLGITGDMTMQKSTTIPQRASRPVQQTTDVEQEYDDRLINNPRSALRYRGFQGQPKEQPHYTTDELDAPVSHRISGSSRLGLYVLLLLCIAFLMSGIQSPFLSGNVITLRVPIVWIVALVAIVIVGVSLLRSKR